MTTNVECFLKIVKTFSIIIAKEYNAPDNTRIVNSSTYLDKSTPKTRLKIGIPMRLETITEIPPKIPSDKNIFLSDNEN